MSKAGWYRDFYCERLLVQKFSGVSLYIHLLLEEVLWCNSFLV